MPSDAVGDARLVFVNAPPGTLGVNFRSGASGEEGVVVKSVKIASPLASLQPGMVLRAMDGTDVTEPWQRSCSSSARRASAR